MKVCFGINLKILFYKGEREREREREFEFMLENGLKIGKSATFCFIFNIISQKLVFVSLIGSILAFCVKSGKRGKKPIFLTKESARYRILKFYDILIL